LRSSAAGDGEEGGKGERNNLKKKKKVEDSLPFLSSSPSRHVRVRREKTWGRTKRRGKEVCFVYTSCSFLVVPGQSIKERGNFPLKKGEVRGILLRRPSTSSLSALWFAGW